MASETSPLLFAAKEPRSRFSPQTLLVPVAVTTGLANTLTSSTFIDLLRRATCELWNMTHWHGDRDAALRAGVSAIPDSVCDAPEVMQYYATIIAMLGVVESIASIVIFGVITRISSQNRRKLVLLSILVLRIIGNLLIPASRYAPVWLAGRFFLVGMIFDSFCGLLPYSYIINMYILESSVPENRTAALSRIAGWSSLGMCISLALGGFITTETDNPFIVFYASAAIFVAVFTYVLFVLPESFSEENHHAPSCVIREQSDDDDDDYEPSRRTLLRDLFVLFEPLKMFMPAHNNWRLAWCGMHTFIFTVADGYVSAAWTVLATSRHHLTPENTGLFFTSITASSAIVLTLIVPLLVRLLGPYYAPRTRSVHAERDASDGPCQAPPEPAISDRLDRHLAFFSCVATGIFYLSAATFTTTGALVFSGVSLGFMSIRGPTICSLVAGTVEPTKQGAALAAIEMITNAGSVLSSIVMGGILARTIETTPLLLFYVHLVVVVISGGLLFLVRDPDRQRYPGRPTDVDERSC